MGRCFFDFLEDLEDFPFLVDFPPFVNPGAPDTDGAAVMTERNKAVNESFIGLFKSEIIARLYCLCPDINFLDFCGLDLGVLHRFNLGEKSRSVLDKFGF